MKRRLNYFFILLCMLFVTACNNKPATSGSAASIDEGAGGCEGEKAKAVLWVDYKKGRSVPDGTSIRAVKVYAHVYGDGTLKVLSFCKKQSMKVENYLLKRVAAYTIRKEIFEQKYLEPGDQYLQLRYIPEWMK